MPLDGTRSTSPTTLTARTISRLDDVTAIAAAWLTLEAAQEGATFFQSLAWCRYVWRTRIEKTTRSPIDHRILVVEDASRILAIWPLAITASRAGRYATDLGEPFGQYSDILIAPGADRFAVLDAAAAELKRWRIDGLVLRKVRADSALTPWLARTGTTIGSVEHAPAIDLAGSGGHDAYRAALNAKTRKNLRNYRNRLAREGALVHDVIASADDRARTIARCFDGRTAWLTAGGLSSTAFADPAFDDIIDGLTKGRRDAPPVIALRLGLTLADTTPIDLSLHWGFEHQGRYYAYMAWKNPAYDEFSPGRLHLEDVIAATAARGMSTVDLLLPALPYKTSLANATIEVRSYGVPFTARGSLYVRGWHGFARPCLKRALMALPPSARRILFRTIKA